MSLEHEEQLLVDRPAEAKHEYQKTLQISYTRDFLLSLSELDICKKLPTGFDHSILSEFEDASYNAQDRQKISGSLSLQSFRRNEYGSSPPTRGDSSNSSRGIHGRWESRSSGRSEKDSDSQSDWDSDSGRRFGNQSRRSWQTPEHDGLLGSGSFPRPSGYAAGASAPKVRANDHYQLNRSNEPYHPPRPYKAVPHSRRDTFDSYNDETFGSAEDTSQDRAEEERKRRVSFELMRKEQQKAFQEKQNLNPDKHKGDSVPDVTALLEDPKDEKGLLNRNSEVAELVIVPDSHNDSGKSSLPSQTPASRPLVPPGFTSTILERNFGIKSIIHPHPAEVGNPELEDSLSHSHGNSVVNGAEKQSAHEMSLSEHHHQNVTIEVPFINKNGNIVNSSSNLESSNKTIGMDSQSYMPSSLSNMHEALENGESTELNMKKSQEKIVGEYSQDNSTSILDKLFGTSLTVASGSSSSFVEQHGSKADDAWSPSTVQSSKFAHWFLEDENKPTDISSGRPSDLLSLITGGEKAGSQVSDLKTSEQIPLDVTSEHNELANKPMASNLTSATVGIPEQLYNSNKPFAIPGVLTCEDLEHSILSEISDNSATLQPPVQSQSSSDVKTQQPKINIDNHASQHLLSLLQKGTDMKDRAPSSNLDMGSSDKLNVFEKENIGSISTEENAEKIHSSGTSLTLETLFGSAFMKELQSVEAPVSVQRSSVGSTRIHVSEPHGLSIPVIDDGLLPSAVGEIRFNRTGAESSVLVSNRRQPTKSDKIGALNTGLNDERSMAGGSEGPPFIHAPYEVMDHQNLHAQPSSPQLHHPQMNHGRPLFHPLDSHTAQINSQMKFMAPENIIHHDPPPNHQFPANMFRPPFHHPSTGLTGFDHPAHHPMLQQMHMPGNFPPPHPLRGFPRGAPLPLRPNNQATNFVQEVNPLQGFPFGHRQPNFGGLGMPVPGPDVSDGSNHPDAIQRLIEMELRANSKQIHPLAAGGGHGGQGHGHGHGLESGGFRYR
ncbi:uncharacterized protein LOC100248277 isoform X3 [Vitis vinifera]|uniref:uncharacterized protein LOC100248277 isoform X3 n=1 Tax=Vitis vinifera TaxID=29760 RepID=UPI00053F5A0E|nr:uncharacterized protein LOC100248277 isoform X3 [Vitis vinifera]|eukprot:XP_010661805.1 PREDICTED: uncharacterized protein LOC100248277 isoform X3 [Vitis vinifera]